MNPSQTSSGLLLVFALFAAPSFAQQAFPFSSTYVVSQQSDLERLAPIKQAFDDLMILYGAELVEENAVMFLIGASEVNEDDYLAISITSMFPLPERIIESGKNGQVFYAGVDEPNLKQLSEDAVQIREMMSEEYIRQFYSIGQNWTIVCREDEVMEKLGKLVYIIHNP
jgi:hypothetical protein